MTLNRDRCPSRGTAGYSTEFKKIFCSSNNLHTSQMLNCAGITTEWKMLPIERNAKDLPEIHYTRIYRAMRRWQANGFIDKIFSGSVHKLRQDGRLDLTVIHGEERGRQPGIQRTQTSQGRQGRRLLRHATATSSRHSLPLRV